MEFYSCCVAWQGLGLGSKVGADPEISGGEDGGNAASSKPTVNDAETLRQLPSIQPGCCVLTLRSGLKCSFVHLSKHSAFAVW